MKLILLGKPGSRKGTQAELLSKKFRMPVITTGVLLRKLEKKPTKLGRMVKSYIDKGAFVPDDLAIQMVKKAIAKKRSYVLDGFPRNLYQAKKLEKFAKIDKVIYIEADEKAIIRRLSSRRQCSCGETYNLLTKRPKHDLICDRCGRKLVRRPDDSPAVIRKRFRIYRKLTKPLISYYKKKDVLEEVNGNQKIKAVFNELLRKLK